MQLPNIVHPKKFLISGYTVGVVSYITLTDGQAAKIAMHGFRSRKWLKKDLKKAHHIYWTGDQSALALLG